ncbi:uncharacterized protein LOC116252898 isoform X2 [Nymphaea colorata]|uniref:uncharacterized protein LOC116252898 isoform X2 n=1 Tax=Nymphaea colorata TaxID=210225 RepID=UPI00129D6193|nr:uncharacterized protein LOC116252898 isoform X2 [Nymphaea colorata]
MVSKREGTAVGRSSSPNNFMHLRESNGKKNGTSEEKEILSRFRAQEQELMQLRKQLADASIKELELLKEKHVLEKRFAGMRLDLDRQQKELLAAASQALSERKKEIEENMNLAETLLATEQERSIFLSSLLRLLADNDLQPVVVNASTIVQNIQVLLQNLRGKLGTTLAGGDSLNNQTIKDVEKLSQNFDIQNPATLSNNNSHFPGTSAPFNFYEDQLYQQHYPPMSAALNMSNNLRMDGTGGPLQRGTKPPPTLEGRPGEAGNYSDQFSFDRVQNLPEDLHVKGVLDGQPNFFNDNEEPVYPVSEGHLLPGIEDFQIYGDARLGSQILACGVQWMYVEDDNYIDIEDATYPEYLVTADDVDKVIAVSCRPLAGNDQKGRVVIAYANNKQKIPLDPDINQEIRTYLSKGKALFNVLLSPFRQYPEPCEQALLVLEISGFKVQFNNSDRVIEKEYSAETSIEIPSWNRTQCILRISDGEWYLLSTNTDRVRDILVLTMREFWKQALCR